MVDSAQNRLQSLCEKSQKKVNVSSFNVLQTMENNYHTQQIQNSHQRYISYTYQKYTITKQHSNSEC